MKEIIPIKIVWESPNISREEDLEDHKILIRDMGSEYRIDSPGAYAIFDKTDKMLNGVIHAVNKYGMLISGKSNAPFFHVPINGKMIYLPLVQIVAGIHKNMPHETFKGKRFGYRDHDHRNLHTSNIWCSGYTVDVFTELGRAYIIVICVKNGKRHFAITNYTPELLALIKLKSWYYDPKSQELTSTKNVKFKHIVWAYYKKNATVENIDGILKQMKKDFNPNDSPLPKGDMLVIDHKISEAEKWDNRIENLQTITFSQNGRKNDCTSRIKDGCFYIPTEDGEIYGKYGNKTISFYHRTGEFTEQEFEKLKQFCKSGELPENHTVMAHDAPKVAEIMKNITLRSLLCEYGKKEVLRTHSGNFFDPTEYGGLNDTSKI